MHLMHASHCFRCWAFSINKIAKKKKKKKNHDLLKLHSSGAAKLYENLIKEASVDRKEKSLGTLICRTCGTMEEPG